MQEKKEDQLHEEKINSPKHYQNGARETLTKIKLLLTPEEYRGFAKGSYIKYEDRMGSKGDKETDLGKADYYATLLENDAAGLDDEQVKDFGTSVAEKVVKELLDVVVEVLEEDYADVDVSRFLEKVSVKGNKQ